MPTASGLVCSVDVSGLYDGAGAVNVVATTSADAVVYI